MTGRKQTAASEPLVSQEDRTHAEQMKSCDTEAPGRPQTARLVMQHQAYQPLFPTGNKYLQQKWDKASYELHRRKVKSAEPTVNTTAPKTFGHLTLKLKKLKLEEEWTTKVQRENNMLREKISHIMKTTGAVDNRNFYHKKSIGMEKRRQELLRITRENQMIVYRLSQCKSHYDTRSWHEDWLQTLKVMDSIARYPRGGGANQPKEREKAGKKSSDCAKAHKSRATHNHAISKTNDMADAEESQTTKRQKEEDAAK